MQFVQPEQTDAERAVVAAFVAHQRHARGDLQALLGEFSAVLEVRIIGVAHHHAGGLEALDLTEARLTELGLPKFTIPVKITCANHAGPRKVAIQQWDAKAKKWSFVTDFYDTMNDIVDPLIDEDSAAYAAENNITPRDC